MSKSGNVHHLHGVLPLVRFLTAHTHQDAVQTQVIVLSAVATIWLGGVSDTISKGGEKWGKTHGNRPLLESPFHMRHNAVRRRPDQEQFSGT